MSNYTILQIIPAPAGLCLYHQKEDGTPWKKERLAALALVDERGSRFVIGLIPDINDTISDGETVYPKEEITLAWSDEEHIFEPGVIHDQGGCQCSTPCAKP